MSNGSGMVRRSLGRQLKALREAAGKSVEDLRPIGSRDKIWRMETGKGPYRFPDVQSWALMCGADPPTVARLTDLAAKAGGDLIYEDFSDVLPSWSNTYFELESVASVITTYEPDVLPGLLQTADYAREVFDGGLVTRPAETVERQVVARLERQRTVLEREPSAVINAVLGAGVLARQVGGSKVMAAQLGHLRELSESNDVHIRVLTWQAGAHAAMEGPFTLLDFSEAENPSVAYVEAHVGARYVDRPTQVLEYREIAKRITEKSVPFEEYTP